MADNATHAWIRQSWTWAVTREHVMSATLVSRFTVSHAARDGDLVHHFGSVDPSLVHKDARHTGLDGAHRTAIFNRSVRLWVEAFLMSHPARQKDENDGLGRAFLAFVVLNFSLTLPKLEVLSQRQANTTTEPNVQKAST